MGIRFHPPSKSLTPRDYQFIAWIVVIFLIVAAALLFVNLKFKGGGGDFYVHWVGARAFIFDKMEPYSGDVAARAQELVYGNSAHGGDKPYILDTPFYILPLYFPFSLLSNPALARALFTLILELALSALVFLSLRLTDWESPRLFFVLFIIFGVFNFYSMQAIYVTSPVLLLALTYVGILFCLRAGLDELAGALVALSFYYWQVGAPFLVLIFLRIFYEKRTRVLAGFLMAIFILLAVSFLLYPGWVMPFLRAMVNNSRVDFGFNIYAAFDHIWPSYGHTFARIFILALAILLAYEWGMARGADFRRFYWASCLSLAAAPLLGFRAELAHSAVLVMPLALVFAIVHDRWHGVGRSLTMALLCFVFILPWGIYFFGQTAQDIIFLFLPVFTLIGLYWIRWWALRPPRTWLDLANRP